MNLMIILRLAIGLAWFKVAFGANIQYGVTSNTLNVGVLLPWSGDWTVGRQIGAASNVAVQDIASLNLLPSGITVEWSWLDTKCASLDGFTAAVTLWNNTDDLDAFIGAGCSTVCRPVALLAAALNLPFVSFGCTQDELSDKTTFPTFTRTVGPWSFLAPVVDKLLEAMGWKTRIGIVSTYESIMISTTNAFKAELERPATTGHTQKTVIYRELTSDGRVSHREIARYMREMVRVLIILMYNHDTHDFLLAARDEFMMNGDYAFITLNADLSEPTRSIRIADSIESYNGILDLHVEIPTGSQWDAFATRVINEFGDSRFTGFSSIGTSATTDQVDVHAMYLYDAFLAWAHGLNAAVVGGPEHIDDGREITSKIRNSQFQGVLDTVIINDQGDRKPDYSFSLVENLKRTQLYVFRDVSGTLTKLYKSESPSDFSGIKWKGGRDGPPLGHPPCGWDHELCDKHIALKATLSTLLVLIVLSVLGFFLYKKWKSHKELQDTRLWKISKEDMGTSKYHSQLAMSREVLKTKTQTSLVDDDRKQVFCQVVTVKGKLCAVKELKCSTVNANDKNILLEMKQMREMHHENINPFVAAVCEHPYVSLLMMYCEKGSLQDVIFNDQVNLNWDFQISFAYDIAQGMNYLHHSPFASHGHLTSNNCVIDNRWVCKITDYGCAHFKARHSPKLSENQQYESLLWTAPELLPEQRGTTFGNPHPYGTKKGDAYSYGIVLYELCVRDRPYAEEREQMEAREVIEHVMVGTLPLFRPVMNVEVIRQDWRHLTELCWEEDPSDRPSFKNIINSLRTMNGESSFGLVDRMVVLMEEHSERLEEIATSRQEQVKVEKKRVENLLSNILPPPVSKVLVEGETFEPDRIDNVSIMFCRLTNLEQIITDYDPQGVVDILNDVYNCFDSVAEDFDVVKVETVSSGQLYSSGCPVPSDDHEFEVAEFCLKLISGFNSWSHPQYPDAFVTLRIGMKSGPIVEGIIGLKVPRYCLFGDTLRVAILLEEASEDMCIHLTEDTARPLRGSNFKLHPGPGIAQDGTIIPTFYLRRASSE